MTADYLALPSGERAEGWVADRAAEQLGRARALADTIKSDRPTDAQEALRRWNDVHVALGAVASISSLFSEVHPSQGVRAEAERAMQQVIKLDTELGLDRELYEVVAALDPAGLHHDAKRLLDKTLLDFHRAGVDKDEPTRRRIQTLQERLLLVGQEFSKNIRSDVRALRLEPSQLKGLPEDWVSAHPPGGDGLVTVTTDYPDALPFRTFAHDAAARRELVVAFLSVGWPQNDPLLQEMFSLRHELAGLLGYATWAEFDTEVKMIKTGSAIPRFIGRIADAALEAGLRDRQVLLDRMRKDHPDAQAIDGADVLFYTEAVAREQFDVDAQRVRTYFDFERVRQGLLDVSGRLFGLRYDPAPDAVVWADDVTAYDVLRDDGSSPFGRIYLDLHPREGKYKHAAQFDLVRGVAGRALPEGALVCNLPRGLMEHGQVVTLFHEFGHLVHHLLAGQQEWVRFSGVATEWDFVEAPSQMLEEWAWSSEVLQTFATNAAGEPLPADLVARMRRADDFGKGFQACTQMFYAAMSYYFHVERPADLTERTRQLQAQYSLFPYIEGTHMPCSFGHLEGYTSGYYTYMWSLVIAKDLFSAFDPYDLFDPVVAGRYRDRVLVPGGSRDAADLVEDFLGRPYTFDAYAAWLAQ